MPAETPPTTRELDWQALVRKAWGKEWTKPPVVYEFTGRKFVDPDGGSDVYHPENR